MSSLPLFDMIEEDTILSQLEYALRVCGLPLTLRSDSYELVGSGAWHDAYRVTVPQHAEPFIIRLRKNIAYGQQQNYEDRADAWQAEYLSSSLYYMQANRVQPKICPSIFMYHVSPEITCTVESYMGKRLSLSQINESQAHRYGWQIGNMVRMMNRKKTHIAGNGELAWDGANLYGTVPEQHPIITQKIEQSYNRNILLTLIEENLFPDQQIIRNKLDEAHAIRSVIEPTMLINRDITPENLTVQSDGRIGIIDPYPYLGNGTRFAAWFIHCYRFLLSTYAQTKRHHHNHYHRHEEKLNLIADGFERGYIQGNTELAQHIAAERWLWTLEQAYDDHKRLQQTDIPEHHIIKHGDSTIVKKRMSQAIHILETLEF